MPSASSNPRRTSAARLSERLAADAVVTAYIHAISERHRAEDEDGRDEDVVVAAA
jgi:hypothetical protein